MPELPEVETVKKALLKKIQNKKILNNLKKSMFKKTSTSLDIRERKYK